MKNPNDKLCKVMIAGQAFAMFCDSEAIERVTSDRKFVCMKDHGNDHVYISLADITAFEVLDDRTDMQIVPPAAADAAAAAQPAGESG